VDLISQKLKNEINIIVAFQLSHIYCVDDKPIHCSLLHVFTRAATSSHFNHEKQSLCCMHLYNVQVLHVHLGVKLKTFLLYCLFCSLKRFHWIRSFQRKFTLRKFFQNTVNVSIFEEKSWFWGCLAALSTVLVELWIIQSEASL